MTSRRSAAHAFAASARAAGLRVEVVEGGSLGSRVRAAAGRKVPFQAVIGAREARDGQVSLRIREEGKQEPQPYAVALADLRRRCAAPDESS